MGGIIFIWLRDRSGIVQVLFDAEQLDEKTYQLGESLRSEYVLAVRGAVSSGMKRTSMPNWRRGAWRCSSGKQNLNKSETPPIYIDDDTKENEAVRLKYRYLRPCRPSMQRTMQVRSKVVNAIRAHMISCGFTEFETPILTKSTPEGARDFLVPSRLHPGDCYALPQSPQIYKQLLMLAGMDRYFQFARCFRDEDSRADRQPEFTQLDLEMTFVEPPDVQEVVEGAFARVFKEVKGIELQLPLRRMTWKEAMEKYGSDKPDTRFDMTIATVNDVVRHCGFSIFEQAVTNGGTVCAIVVPKAAGQLSRKDMDALNEFVKTYHVKGLAWLAINEDGSHRSSFARFLKEEDLRNLLNTLGAGAGDAVFLIAEKAYRTHRHGAAAHKAGRQLGMIDETVYSVLWITEFPCLNGMKKISAMYRPIIPSPCPWRKTLA